MKYAEIEQWLWEEAEGVAKTWWSLKVRNQFTSFYLYHKPGELTVAAEAPDGFELSTGERIKPNQTIEQCRAWVVNQALRLPILTPEMSA